MSEIAAAIEREANACIAEMFAAVRVAEKAGFKPLRSDDDFKTRFSGAYYDSRYSIGAKVNPWIPGFFRSNRHPYLPELKAVRSYFSGEPKHWEVIRHQFTAEGLDIVVMETVNEALVLLPNRGDAMVRMAPAARVNEITRVAAVLFVEHWGKAKWHARGSIVESGKVGYTTAPMVSPDDSSAGRFRMDAGVWQNNLYFLYYKTHNEQRSFRQLKGVRWFDKGKKAKR